MNIVAAFDIDEELYDDDYGGKRILPMDKLMDLCERMRVRIGIITVPAENAQAICNLLIESGILAIWNFAPVHLEVPDASLCIMKTWPRPSHCSPSSCVKGLKRADTNKLLRRSTVAPLSALE